MGAAFPLICGMGVIEVVFEVGPCLLCRGFDVPAFNVLCKDACVGGDYFPMLMSWVSILEVPWDSAIATYLRVVLKKLSIGYLWI